MRYPQQVSLYLKPSGAICMNASEGLQPVLTVQQRLRRDAWLSRQLPLLLQVGPPAKTPEDGAKAKIKVKVRLNLHGILGVESVQQIEEEEYEETVTKKAEPLKVVTCSRAFVKPGCFESCLLQEACAARPDAQACH